jgi:branched-chain amino acid transport system permease protein
MARRAASEGPKWPWIAAFLIVAADAYLCACDPRDLDRLLINSMLALSAFATLHVRMLSLASAGFAAVGAYTSAILAAKLGWPVYASIPAAALACGAVAMVIGLPVLRLKDVYLAICTLGFGEVVRVSIILLPGLTGGSTGANLSTGFGYETMKQTRTWALAPTLAVLCYLFWSASKSRTGRALRAIRENPEAAEAMGIDVVAGRNFAFLASALIAGLAGAFYAHSVGSLENGDFRFSRAVDILGYAVLGGSGAWFGPVLGAGFLTALPILIRDGLGSSLGFLKGFAQLPNILSGLALMLVIILAPGGLASAFPRLPERGRPEGRRRQARGPRPEGAAAAPSSAAGPKGKVLLSLKGLGRSFGGVEALADLSFDMEEGVTYGLIGPNGAGKTTLINLVSGFIPPSHGKIEWLGREIQGLGACRAARAGIARTYQDIRLFAEMSVLENVVAGRHIRLRSSLPAAWLRLPSERREEADAREESMDLLDRLGLSGLADREAGKLSYGDRRRVEIARALALEPRLLMLDEPAAGMNERETAALGDFIVDLKRQGVALLMVEHHMDLIMDVCDEIVVLDFGRKIAQGAPAEVARDEAVLEAYLGRD